MTGLDRDGVAAAPRLAEIRERMAAACRRAGRDPAAVSLLAASKTQPAEALLPLVRAGLRLFGENRVQEAQGKQQALTQLLSDEGGGAALEWHLIGPLQTNKVRLALDLFTCIHSIDRLEVAEAVDRAAARRGKALAGLLEVNLGNEPTKHGFPAAGLAAAAQPLAGLAHLRIAGLMAIPPQETSELAIRRWFRQLRDLRDELGGRPEWQGWPGLLSMGMSHDFELAIEEGATHVRVGTALFGPRG
jgi:pyridoxal phosphate enzyme (YggS family)